MTTIWFDGELMPLSDAPLTAFAHTLHYGVGVFEGVRAYAGTSGGGAIFRLDAHLRRLEESARVCGLRLPYDRDALAEACVATLHANGLVDAYLRPLAFQDDGTLGGLGSSPPVRVMIAAQPWGAYLGEDGLTRGIRTRISAHRRGGHGSFMSRAKICGQYVASTLAKREALALGLDEALLTDDSGHVCEGSGENLFLVREGSLLTPPASAAILPGITRDTVLWLAEEMRDELSLTRIRKQAIPRDLLLVADEVFLTGTAAEVTPVREVDSHTIGEGRAGPVTAALQQAYFQLVRGERSAPEGWLHTFDAPAR